jgi:hydrogenase expression/formation protein HypC
MCLAIPSKIVEITKEGLGIIDVDGVRRECSLIMMNDLQIGDYVIVHAGFALHKIDEVEAGKMLDTLREVAAYSQVLEREKKE